MNLALIVLIGQMSFFPKFAMAQGQAGANFNPVLNTKAEILIKNAMVVLREEDFVITMTSPGNSYVAKTQMLFFRKRGTRIQMIATGVFQREQLNPVTKKKEIVAELNRDSVIKYPQVGDYVVPMTDPNLAALDGKSGGDGLDPDDESKPKPPNPLPGYFEAGMGILGGSMKTVNSAQVNIAKFSSGYRFALMHLAYYSDFFPVGIEYDSRKGDFPTATRGQTVVNSSESVSSLGFVYRFMPMMNKHLALKVRVKTHNHSFITNNVDDSLIATNISGLGFGGSANYDFISPIWKKEPNDLFFQLQGLNLDFTYYPSIKAEDQLISRGTSSSGSTALQYRLGATGLAWISFIPIFKRWVINGSYGVRQYNLKFSGATVSEPLNPVKVAPNGTSTDSESEYRIFIGIRLEDPITLLFADDDKKQKKKEK